MNDTVTLVLDSCQFCPKRKESKYYTADSFEHVVEWKCADKSDKRIALLEWNDTPPPPPIWCPLRSE